MLATFFSIIFILYSKPASWLSSFRQPPKALSFLAYRLLSISRGQNPGRDCAEWSSPTGSFRYEVHPMRCFHYPPPRYSHRPSPGRSTYRMPWHPSHSVLFCPSYLRHRCGRASDPYHQHARSPYPEPASEPLPADFSFWSL